MSRGRPAATAPALRGEGFRRPQLPVFDPFLPGSGQSKGEWDGPISKITLIEMVPRHARELDGCRSLVRGQTAYRRGLHPAGCATRPVIGGDNGPAAPRRVNDEAQRKKIHSFRRTTKKILALMRSRIHLVLASAIGEQE